MGARVFYRWVGVVVAVMALIALLQTVQLADCDRQLRQLQSTAAGISAERQELDRQIKSLYSR